MTETAEQPDGHQDEALATSVARGGLWSIGWQIVGLLTGLIATPFTIRLLGGAGYGAWALLQTAMTWIVLADIGMSVVSTRFAGESFARGDGDGEAEAIWTAAAITTTTTAIAAGAAAWFAPAIVEHVLHIRGSLRGPTVLGLRFIAIALIATVINNTFNTPQVVRLRWFSNTLTTSGSAVLAVILIPIALWLLGGSAGTAAGITAGTSLLGAAGTVWVAARLQPKVLRPRVRVKLGRSMVSYGAAASLSGIATIVLTSAERLLLGHYAGVVTVAIYVVASRLGTLVSAIPQAVSAPLLPALVRLHGAQSDAEARRLYAHALQGSFLLLTPAILLLAYMARPFLSAWAGQRYGAHSTGVTYVVLAGVWFSSMAYMPETYLFANGRAWFVARLHLLEVLPYLIAAAVLTANLGALGAAIVWSGRSMIDALIIFPLAGRAGRLTLSPFSGRRLRSAVAPALLALAVILLSHVTSGLGVRVAVSSALVVIYSASAWWVVLTDPERSGLVSLWVQLNPRSRQPQAWD